MALYALGRTHLTEKDLLGDLIEWSRMAAIHSPEYKSKDAKQVTKKVDYNASKQPSMHAWTQTKLVEDKTI